MNAAANLPSNRDDPWAEPIRVVILYESSGNLENAQGVVRSLASTAGTNRDIKLAAWSFDMLTRLDLRHASAAIGAQMDLLLIAAAASSHLPTHVQSWITECLRENSKGAPCIVGLYETRDGRARAVPAIRSDLLNLVANRTAKPLFNTEFDPQAEWHHLEEFSDHDLVRTDRSDAELLFARPSGGHWGINE